MMNRFIKNSIHFALYVVLINMVCYGIIKVTYYDEYSAFDDSFETYLFADSHGHQLDTLTESVGIYNFSDPSDSYEDMLRKIKYTVANSEVKKIIISADLHNLSSYREEQNNLDRSAIYATKGDYENSYSQFKERYFRRYVPLLNGKSRDALLLELKSLIPRSLAPVPLWMEKTKKERLADAKKRTDIHFEGSERSKKMEELLLQITTLCQENKIELQGILFPLTPEYRSQKQGRGYDAATFLAQQNVQLMDYSTLFENRADYFRDQDHLNYFGAQAFIKLLKN